MGTCETSTASASALRESVSWIDRLPRWLTDAGHASTDEPNGFGPIERLLFFVALACIVVWGFSGPGDRSSEWTLQDEVGSIDVGRSESAGPAVERGARLFEENGCYACHSIDGSRGIGPSLQGVFGQTVDLAGGGTALIDDAYILESILNPQAKVVAGFEEAAMPSYEDVITADDAAALAEYVKSLN